MPPKIELHTTTIENIACKILFVNPKMLAGCRLDTFSFFYTCCLCFNHCTAQTFFFQNTDCLNGGSCRGADHIFVSSISFALPSTDCAANL